MFIGDLMYIRHFLGTLGLPSIDHEADMSVVSRTLSRLG